MISVCQLCFQCVHLVGQRRWDHHIVNGLLEELANAFLVWQENLGLAVSWDLPKTELIPSNDVVADPVRVSQL